MPIEPLFQGRFGGNPTKKIEILPVPFQDTMTLGCNVMSLGGDVKQAAKAAGVPPTDRAIGAFQARMSMRAREDWSRLAQELLEVERRTRRGVEVDASDFCKLALSWKTAPAGGRR